ncbi:MAG: hypothetical protein HC883_00680 [Bdellovibrionaceae bacterium]|nr:hypothetical protein [Pseudobdellovibrionaceae bacterium]
MAEKVAAPEKIQPQQRQKERAKEIRREKKQAERGPRFFYPEPVQEALVYFKDNGFPLDPPELADLVNAKKILSRVFHPDKGGSHEEAITLNQNYEILLEYLER